MGEPARAEQLQAATQGDGRQATHDNRPPTDNTGLTARPLGVVACSCNEPADDNPARAASSRGIYAAAAKRGGIYAARPHTATTWAGLVPAQVKP